MSDQRTVLRRPIAIRCMRFSTASDRDEERAIAALHAAFDAGVTFLDTADAYCLDASETGHNERLIARALATWPGDSSSVRVATKGGLIRPDGRWEADGRARALTSACEASLGALGLDRIPLYQLHAPDPRVPLATSVRALHALARRGLIEAIGLSNVTVGQIEEARRITDIASVQVELSLWNDASVLGGVVGYCIRVGIPLLAYRPLGGPERRRRLETDPVLAKLAADHGATAPEMALAALADLSPLVWPIAGPTRVETAQSIARAARISLSDAARAALRARFPTLGSDLEFRSSRGSDLEFPDPDVKIRDLTPKVRSCSSWGCRERGRARWPDGWWRMGIPASTGTRWVARWPRCCRRSIAPSSPGCAGSCSTIRT